jgi:hypothetical protein
VAAAAEDREAQRALIFPTDPTAWATGAVTSLWLAAIFAAAGAVQAVAAGVRVLHAYVWPTGPTGVAFSDDECAELHRLLSLFYNYTDWPYKVGPDGFVRVEWKQFRSWLAGQAADSELYTAWLREQNPAGRQHPV